MNSPPLVGFNQQYDGQVRVQIPPYPTEIYSYSASESFEDVIEHDKQQENNSPSPSSGGSSGGSNHKVSVLTRLKKQLTSELYITGDIL